MSNILSTMLTVPRPNNKESAIVAIVLEYCSIANSMPDDAWKVNRGKSNGVDKTNVSNAPPTTIPATNTATMAYL